MLRFCMTFAFLAGALAALSETAVARAALHAPLARGVARAAALLLSLFGTATAEGARLRFDGFEADIVEACDGVLPSVIYAAAVLAFPSRWRDKGRGLLLGIPLIAAVNLVRVVSLMILGARRPQLFEVVHIYVWQAVIIGCAVAFWLYWAERHARPGVARGA